LDVVDDYFGVSNSVDMMVLRVVHDVLCTSAMLSLVFEEFVDRSYVSICYIEL